MRQGLNTREKVQKIADELDEKLVSEADYNAAYIVAFCCAATCVLVIVAMLVKSVWPYIVNAVSAALN